MDRARVEELKKKPISDLISKFNAVGTSQKKGDGSSASVSHTDEHATAPSAATAPTKATEAAVLHKVDRALAAVVEDAFDSGPVDLPSLSPRLPPPGNAVAADTESSPPLPLDTLSAPLLPRDYYKGQTKAQEMSGLPSPEQKSLSTPVEHLRPPSPQFGELSASSAGGVREGTARGSFPDVVTLMERCQKLEARLMRQNDAVQGLENELKDYEKVVSVVSPCICTDVLASSYFHARCASLSEGLWVSEHARHSCGNTYKRAFAHDAWQGMHEALMLLGIEHGLQGLQGPCAATAQLKLCVQTLLDSESHLLGRAEEMHEVILQHKELEAAIMKKLNSHVSMEQALLDSELSPASLIQNEEGVETQEQSSYASAGAAKEQEVELEELREQMRLKDEELRELYAYSTQLLEKICKVEEDAAALEAQNSADTCLNEGEVAMPEEGRADSRPEQMARHAHEALLKERETAWLAEKSALLDVIARQSNAQDEKYSAPAVTMGGGAGTAAMSRQAREDLYESIRVLLGLNDGPCAEQRQGRDGTASQIGGDGFEAEANSVKIDRMISRPALGAGTVFPSWYREEAGRSGPSSTQAMQHVHVLRPRQLQWEGVDGRVGGVGEGIETQSGVPAPPPDGSYAVNSTDDRHGIVPIHRATLGAMPSSEPAGSMVHTSTTMVMQDGGSFPAQNHTGSMTPRARNALTEPATFMTNNGRNRHAAASAAERQDAVRQKPATQLSGTSVATSPYQVLMQSRKPLASPQTGIPAASPARSNLNATPKAVTPARQLAQSPTSEMRRYPSHAKVCSGKKGATSHERDLSI